MNLPSATGMAAEVVGQTKHAMLRSKLRKMAGIDTEGGMPGDESDMGGGMLSPDEATMLMEALGSEQGTPPGEPMMAEAGAAPEMEMPAEPPMDAPEPEMEEEPVEEEPKRRGLRY